jgi:hypothetical protein
MLEKAKCSIETADPWMLGMKEEGQEEGITRGLRRFFWGCIVSVLIVVMVSWAYYIYQNL